MVLVLLVLVLVLFFLSARGFVFVVLAGVFMYRRAQVLHYQNTGQLSSAVLAPAWHRLCLSKGRTIVGSSVLWCGFCLYPYNIAFFILIICKGLWYSVFVPVLLYAGRVIIHSRGCL